MPNHKPRPTGKNDRTVRRLSNEPLPAEATFALFAARDALILALTQLQLAEPVVKVEGLTILTDHIAALVADMSWLEGKNRPVPPKDPLTALVGRVYALVFDVTTGVDAEEGVDTDMRLERVQEAIDALR